MNRHQNISALVREFEATSVISDSCHAVRNRASNEPAFLHNIDPKNLEIFLDLSAQAAIEGIDFTDH